MNHFNISLLNYLENYLENARNYRSLVIYIFDEMRIVSQTKMRIAGNFDDFLRRKSSSFHFSNIQNFYLLPMQAKSASSRLNEVSKVQKHFRILNRPKYVTTLQIISYLICPSIFSERI